MKCPKVAKCGHLIRTNECAVFSFKNKECCISISGNVFNSTVQMGGGGEKFWKFRSVILAYCGIWLSKP